jgi:DNA polymerase-3 subunit delta
MVAYKTKSFRQLLKTFSTECRAALIYGPDAGLVAERAAALADMFAGKRKDATEFVRLDERDLAEDPALIEVELRTVPMFAERKVVRVTASSRLDVPSLKTLLEAQLANALIVEAGVLRPDSALRKLFEAHPTAAAIASYADEDSISDLIDAELHKADLAIDNDARAHLMTRLGADQALSRAEVVKLALFAAGSGRIEHADIDAIVGDSAEIAVETFVYEVSGGNTREAVRQLARLAAAGTEPSVALPALSHRRGASRGRRRGAVIALAAATSAVRPKRRSRLSQPPPRRPAVARGPSADPRGSKTIAAQSGP